MKKKITPEKISLDFDNGLINKKDSLSLLESIISESEENDIRIKAIATIGQLHIQSNKSFKLLEKSLVSDESPLVRIAAAQILMQLFSKIDIKPLIWAIENENSVLFFKPLLDLFESDPHTSIDELKEKVINKLTPIYNLQYLDMKFIIDVDFLDACRFMSEITDFKKKFDIENDYRLELIKENTSISNKGLTRVNAISNGHITNLTLKELNHIPISINSLPSLNVLTIDHCKFKEESIYELNLPTVNKLKFTNNSINRIPNWVWEIAKKKNNLKNFIKNGVNLSEAPVLALIEILTGMSLNLIKKFEKPRLKKTLGYKIDDLGHIIGIIIAHENVKIGVFPQQLCDLNHLEELHLIRQNINQISKCIIKLNKLKILNLSFNQIGTIPENINFINNLAYLDLRSDNDNVIMMIPPSISRLINLKVLDLRGNIIKNIPEVLKKFEPLKL